MRHLKTFESYSVAASSPETQKAVEFFKEALESSPEFFQEIDEIVNETKSQLTSSDIQAIENLLQHTPEELSDKVAMEAPSLTGESRRYAKSRKYTKYQPVYESLWKKLSTGVAAILQWGGIGTAVYGFYEMVVGAIQQTEINRTMADAILNFSMGYAPIALLLVALGFLVSKGKNWYENIGVNPNKLPRGWK